MLPSVSNDAPLAMVMLLLPMTGRKFSQPLATASTAGPPACVASLVTLPNR